MLTGSVQRVLNSNCVWARSSMVEQLALNQLVVGSIPSALTGLCKDSTLYNKTGKVASSYPDLVGMWGAHSSVGRAHAWHAWGRGFESR